MQVFSRSGYPVTARRTGPAISLCDHICSVKCKLARAAIVRLETIIGAIPGPMGLSGQATCICATNSALDIFPVGVIGKAGTILIDRGPRS